MASWHINTVRVPLNEDCWLGINNAPAAYSGAPYRSAIEGFVDRLHAAGLVAILDLHWTAAGTDQSTGQQQMADADHSPAFWTSVATMFKSDTSTVLDLFNEPHDITWTCWRDGGDCGVGYQVAGMQALVTAVRDTGATNPLMLGGLAYANDLSSWLAYEPDDPAHNLLASWHSYNFNACSDVSCWNTQVAPIAATVPLIVGELGENDCAHSYIDALMSWLDSHHSGYLGWGWNPFDCGGFPALISDYTGVPTSFGAGLRDHLAALASGTNPTPAPTTAPATPPASPGPTSSSSPQSPTPGCPPSTAPVAPVPSSYQADSPTPSSSTSSAPMAGPTASAPSTLAGPAPTPPGPKGTSRRPPSRHGRQTSATSRSSAVPLRRRPPSSTSHGGGVGHNGPARRVTRTGIYQVTVPPMIKR